MFYLSHYLIELWLIFFCIAFYILTQSVSVFCRIIKMTSPNINVVIVSGAVIGYLCIVLFGIEHLIPLQAYGKLLQVSRPNLCGMLSIQIQILKHAVQVYTEVSYIHQWTMSRFSHRGGGGWNRCPLKFRIDFCYSVRDILRLRCMRAVTGFLRGSLTLAQLIYNSFPRSDMTRCQSGNEKETKADTMSMRYIR